ncbi:hypothetical protein ARMSODRAFT_449819 [Armillaria solidipes]|uniref:Uncharacterized protein n=1 Tax=Armillaria solidipes TaxID=1076256 RepID=A0A2H3B834_9AGAR|nr:hypothetical protein ARMSODRAFT_449819 [Armillaria solidipes]
MSLTALYLDLRLVGDPACQGHFKFILARHSPSRMTTVMAPFATMCRMSSPSRQVLSIPMRLSTPRRTGIRIIGIPRVHKHIVFVHRGYVYIVHLSVLSSLAEYLTKMVPLHAVRFYRNRLQTRDVH